MHATNALIPVDTTDDQLIALWLRGHSERTRRAYAGEIARFRAYTNKTLSQVILSDLHDFLDGLDALKDSSRARALSAVKSLLSFAQKTGYLPVNVGAAIKLPKVKMQLAERIMSESEVARMLALEEHARNHALLRLLYIGGLRASEAAALCWRDLAENGDAGQVTVHGKGEKTRVVLLNAETWQELLAIRRSEAEDADPVFLSRTTRYRGNDTPAITPVMIWRIVKKAATRASVKPGVSPHWLRHAHASHALDRGAPISLVRDTLGHASIQTTGRYAHARPKDSSARYLP